MNIPQNKIEIRNLLAELKVSREGHEGAKAEKKRLESTVQYVAIVEEATHYKENSESIEKKIRALALSVYAEEKEKNVSHGVKIRETYLHPFDKSKPKKTLYLQATIPTKIKLEEVE